MRSLTLVLPYSHAGDTELNRLSLFAGTIAKQSLVRRILILHQGAKPPRFAPKGTSIRSQFLQIESWYSGLSINRVLEVCDTDRIVFIPPGHTVEMGQRALERFLSVAEDTGAGLVFSDFREMSGEQVLEHPTIDYQPGSIRDSFDFGSVLLISKRAAEQALEQHGRIDPQLRWAGLYDLRLKISTDFPIVRIPESLYTRWPIEFESGGLEKIHEYVDPRNREYQLEMELVATEHLRRIGAYLEPVFSPPPPPDDRFPVAASIIIPVRNREKTIADALRSAVSQSTSFPYNVIVVDNHSTDRTTWILRELVGQHENLVHRIPERTDLGIGGCWNEAIYSPECGLFAVQLDSDDLYADTSALEKIVRSFRDPVSTREAPNYAMVIGSYTTVNFDLQQIMPGLIDHREWTRENGRNNALRILGFGAPRAYYVPVLRRFGFPNVSYGEDYAISLRISREYEVGRIYDSLYLVRRWEDNTDRALPLAVMNRYDAYKDWVRTVEIHARQK